MQSDGDTIEAHAIITACTPREAKYLLEHLLDMALNWVSEGETEEEVGGRGGEGGEGRREGGKGEERGRERGGQP